ncbi:MAG: hypothetical protein OXB97_01790 [Rhodospirillales bacterium]|nr:hypothetical protein [Rhodospirillales bacterium]
MYVAAGAGPVAVDVIESPSFVPVIGLAAETLPGPRPAVPGAARRGLSPVFTAME